MKTQELEKQRTVNFLYFSSKFVDLRYEFHNSNYMRSTQETIYWVGVIDLEDITEQDSCTNISFLAKRHGEFQLQVDSYHDRYEDGAKTGKTAMYNYEISNLELRREIFNAKKSGKKYFNVLLEEIVNGYGDHEVNLLYDDKGVETVRGIATSASLTDLPLKECLWLYDQSISPETNRICLLMQGGYHWMK